MKREAITTAMLLGFVVAAVFSSYALATAGEPQSVWLWRDVLGIALSGR